VLAWLVRREGERYRHDLKERRETVVKGIEPQERGLTLPDMSDRPAATGLAGPAPPPAATSSVDQHAAESAEAGVAVQPTPAEQKRPPPKKNLTIDAESPQLSGLSTETLDKIAEKLYETVKSAHPIADLPKDARRLELLAMPFLGAFRPDEPRLQLHILESGDVTAFSHVRKHIYVSRGIFALAQVDSELEFVLAHELAHLELGHEAARLEQVAKEAGLAAGRIAGLYYLLALGYSDQQEFEADAWAFDALLRAGRSRREALGFLRRYAGYAAEHELVLGRRPPKSAFGDARQDVENHYAAHPPALERIARLEAARSPAKKDRAIAKPPQ
jgi:beta-barrel assembly-enhancing protease